MQDQNWLRGFANLEKYHLSWDLRVPYWHLGMHMNMDITAFLIEGREDRYLRHFFRDFAYNPDAVPEEEIERYVNQMRQPGNLRASLNHYGYIPQMAEQTQGAVGGGRLITLGPDTEYRFIGVQRTVELCRQHRAFSDTVPDYVRRRRSSPNENEARGCVAILRGWRIRNSLCRPNANAISMLGHPVIE